jgi:hypothetical protein
MVASFRLHQPFSPAIRGIFEHDGRSDVGVTALLVARGRVATSRVNRNELLQRETVRFCRQPRVSLPGRRVAHFLGTSPRQGLSV